VKRRTMSWHGSVLLVLITIVGIVAGSGTAVAATRHIDQIVLPGASSAEGIAKGPGATFYAGDLFRGDIFRGNLQRGTAKLFIDAPDGRMAVGMFADVRRHLLFVAGGPGAAYVYDTQSGDTVASYQLGDPSQTFINDVVVTRKGAWFTNSLKGELYFVPIGRTGEPGPAGPALILSGPAAQITGDFNLNGITATPDGKKLVVAHTANGALYTVDPQTGASATIAGVSVPNVDGIVLEGRRIWAVQGADYLVARIRLSPDLTSGTVEERITDKALQFPSTAIRYGHRLAVVNAKFNTGFPPTAKRYEVVLLDAH
jgi:sugar lactone lactonase YvrE